MQCDRSPGISSQNVLLFQEPESVAAHDLPPFFANRPGGKFRSAAVLSSQLTHGNV